MCIYVWYAYMCVCSICIVMSVCVCLCVCVGQRLTSSIFLDYSLFYILWQGLLDLFLNLGLLDSVNLASLLWWFPVSAYQVLAVQVGLPHIFGAGALNSDRHSHWHVALYPLRTGRLLLSHPILAGSVLQTCSVLSLRASRSWRRAPCSGE